MRRRSDSGYALLLILLMAAVIAISLYMELPRIGFESQRQKEELLIERGEQYKRALQLFTDKNKRWPARIEELENTNNQRFLRKRYKDPITGKDEWREIHIANGILQDSKTNKRQQQGSEKDALAGQYVAEMPGIGQTQSGQGGAALAKTRTRASDSLAPGLPPGTPGGPPQTTDPSSNYPAPGTAAVPGQPVQGVPAQGFPGQPTSGMPGPTGFPGGQPYPPGVTPPQGIPGLPGYTGPTTPGQIINGRVFQGQYGVPGSTGTQSAVSSGGSYISGGAYIGGGQPTTPTPQYPGGQNYPQGPGSPINSQNQPQGVGFQQPGLNTNNPAANMIYNALTSPRPQGGGTGGPQTNAIPIPGAGIAGFASKAEADSIMIYNDHQNYSEWEFIFDPNKRKQVFNPLSGGTGTPASQMNQSTSQSQPNMQAPPNMPSSPNMPTSPFAPRQ